MSDIRLSPFYNSAVNAVTQPNKLTHTSHYFIDRWMPLLGGNGTLIVLALRRDGFLNRKTGELRDEIVISRADLATAAGMSEDTLTREMGINKKTREPQNKWLASFVQKRTRKRRNRAGQIRQEESAYWISMDDPIHPDDWHLVQQFAAEAEGRVGKRPETHFAFPVIGQQAQNAETQTQGAESKTQSASHQKSQDSSLLKNTLQDTAVAAPDFSFSLSRAEQEKAEAARREAERQAKSDQAAAATEEQRLWRQAQREIAAEYASKPPATAEVLRTLQLGRLTELRAEKGGGA